VSREEIAISISRGTRSTASRFKEPPGHEPPPESLSLSLSLCYARAREQRGQDPFGRSRARRKKKRENCTQFPGRVCEKRCAPVNHARVS